MDRRSALRLIVLAGFSFAASSAGARSHCGAFEEIDAEAVGALGREYTSLHADDAEIARIRALITSRDEDAAISALQEAATADFTSGRLVALSGWFVSLTEARLFAALSRCG